MKVRVLKHSYGPQAKAKQEQPELLVGVGEVEEPAQRQRVEKLFPHAPRKYPRPRPLALAWLEASKPKVT